jgi:hypothetical protein
MIDQDEKFKWEHCCDIDWLRERQNYLTASEIRSLLPVTKTGRPRKITDDDRLKVLAGKMKELTQDDCMSYGAAARGHILEPYAVHELNNFMESGHYLFSMPYEEFYWWDDKLVSVEERDIAFSPDALNISMSSYSDPADIHAMAEIKCYSPERHITTAYTRNEDREERWQIATAMTLLPSIDYAYLVLYNPSIKAEKCRLFISLYHRRDLQDEIDMIRQVERDWFMFRKVMPPVLHVGTIWCGSECCDEEEIIKKIKEHSRLNP